MNWGTILLVLAAVLVGAVFLWPSLFPDENQRALQRLNELIQTWNAIRDLQGELTILRPGEPVLKLNVLFLAGLAVRLEITEPEELRGEVFALRAVPEGWLLVHSRPALSLGLEARFPTDFLSQMLAELGGASPEKLRFSWPKEEVLRISGLSGPFTAVEIEVGENFRLPQKILAFGASGQTLEVQMEGVRVNEGLELRDLLFLDPLPTRWIRIPIPAGGA